MTEHILPGVEHSFSFFRVQLVDEVCRVVFIAVLIPTHTHTVKENRRLSLHLLIIPEVLLQIHADFVSM